MNRRHSDGALSGPLIAVLLGVLGGLALLAASKLDTGFGGPKIDRSGRVEIGINGVEAGKTRDVLLPEHGWTLQVRFPEFKAAEASSNLDVRLRSERTGATIQIEDRFDYRDEIATLTMPESIGLAAGLLSIRARILTPEGRLLEDSRRIRIRPWFGGSPIGSRQVIHFDFDVDADGDAVPDFHRDLERFGLASGQHPELARLVAARIEERAIARVERAYDAGHDPNQTGAVRDQVHVRFRFSSDPAALVTRICVGGVDPKGSTSVGHVRFDRGNEDKLSEECGGGGNAGIFPAEIEIYRDSLLYREVLRPFLRSEGGLPIGEDPNDARILHGDLASDQGSEDSHARAGSVDRGITVFAHVLGSIMAHEAGHALGLVADGKPGIGLFGGRQGDAYAHNVDSNGKPEANSWIMNPGGGFSFEELAGAAESGVLNFRPLNYAYLRDRVVLADKRSSASGR